LNGIEFLDAVEYDEINLMQMSLVSVNGKSVPTITYNTHEDTKVRIFTPNREQLCSLVNILIQNNISLKYKDW